MSNDVFATCKAIEAVGYRRIRRFFDEGFDRWSYTGGACKLRLEQAGVDLVVNHGNREFGVDCKFEKENTWKRLFLETWSNKRTQRRGWMHTCSADELWYHFNSEPWLYRMNVDRLKEWAFTKDRLANFQERAQNKYVQHNDTYGRPVSISILIDEIDMTATHLPWLQTKETVRLVIQSKPPNPQLRLDF